MFRISKQEWKRTAEIAGFIYGAHQAGVRTLVGSVNGPHLPTVHGTGATAATRIALYKNHLDRPTGA